MPKQLTIVERGLYKVAFCDRCNAEFKSSLIKPAEAEMEIRNKLAAHSCKALGSGKGHESNPAEDHS